MCSVFVCQKATCTKVGGGQHVAQREPAFDVFVVLFFDVFVVLCFGVFVVLCFFMCLCVHLMCLYEVGGGQAGCGTKRTRF